jgi:colanic acid biosynthesis protein WcaH
MVTKLSQEAFEEIYSKVPRLTVDLLINGVEGFLLTKRNIEPWKDHWHLPGGSVLSEESIEEALRRVAKEELGLEISSTNLIGYIECTSGKEVPGYRHPVSLVFAVKVSSENVVLNDQASDARFFKEIPEKIIPEQSEFLEEHFQQKDKL